MAKPDYDFTSATFFFFKRAGQNPGGALYLGLTQAILYGAVFVIAMVLQAPYYQLIMDSAINNTEPDPAELFAAFASVSGAVFLLPIANILISLSVQGAWMRLLTRGEVAPVFPLRLGKDEFLLFMVNLCFIAMAFVGYFVVLILMAISFGLSIGLTASGDGSVASVLTGGIIGFLIVTAILIGTIIILIRFAAAPALSVVRQNFQLFESFSATKSITGWMFLSYLVLLLLYMVVGGIVSFIALMLIASGAITAFDVFQSSGINENSSLEQFMTVFQDIVSDPTVLASGILTVLVVILFQIVFEGSWHGVGAYAAVRHAESDEGQPEDISAPAESVGAAPGEG